jgi:hypothetical protein
MATSAAQGDRPAPECFEIWRCKRPQDGLEWRILDSEWIYRSDRETIVCWPVFEVLQAVSLLAL